MTVLQMTLAATMVMAAPIANAQSSRNRAIIEVVDLDSLSLAPDGKLLLFRTSKQDVAANRTVIDWYELDTNSGAVRRLGSAGDAIFDDPGVLRAEPPLWLSGGQMAVVRQRTAGATGLWSFRRSTGAFAPIVVDAADVESPRLGPDGTSIVYDIGPSREAIRTAEETERDEGIRISPNVDLAQSLFRGGSVEGRKASQRLTGYWYMRGGLLAGAPRQMRRWDSVTGQDIIIGPPEPPASFKPPPLLSVASIAMANGDQADAYWDGFPGRLEWQAMGRPKIQCGQSACRALRVSSLAWRREGRELLVTFADRHLRQTLALWDLGRNRLHTITGGQGLLSGSRQGSTPCAVNDKSAFCVAADAAGPPRLVQVDLRSGKTHILFDPNAALRGAYQPMAEALSLRLKDGTPVAAWLLGGTALERKPAPLFVNYNRCEGFLRGGEGDEWPMAALLDAGYMVSCINGAPFRGPQDAIQSYDQGVAAVHLLIDKLTASRRIDPHRVAMGGFSFGSEVAMRTAMKTDLLAAVSIASAQAEPSDYWFGAILGGAHDKVEREVWGLGKPEETPERWKLVSPALNAPSIRAAILMQLPEQEARRNPELYVRLRAAGTPVEFYAFPDEAHLMVEPRHRLAAANRNFDWFTYWLEGRRNPGPEKAEQYRRWDQMRADRLPNSNPLANSLASVRASQFR